VLFLKASFDKLARGHDQPRAIPLELNVIKNPTLRRVDDINGKIVEQQQVDADDLAELDLVPVSRRERSPNDRLGGDLQTRCARHRLINPPVFDRILSS
jgi:hypothetical protein